MPKQPVWVYQCTCGKVSRVTCANYAEEHGVKLGDIVEDQYCYRCGTETRHVVKKGRT